MGEFDGIWVAFGRLVEEPTCEPMTLPPPLFEMAMLTDSDSLANWLWLMEFDVDRLADALADVLTLSDVEAERLADSDGSTEVDSDASPTTDPSDGVASDTDCDSLLEPESLAATEPLDSEALSDVEPDPLPASDAADSLAAGALDSVVDSLAAGALDSVADSLAAGAADSVAESEVDSLAGPVLPGASATLPSVARVFMLAAVTS